MKIKVGDKVLVTAGKDRGKTAKIMRVDSDKNKVVAEGVFKVKKHVKATEDKKGGIIEFEKPISSSNVMVVCPHCTKATKVKYNELKGKDKKRLCKKCGDVLDNKVIVKK